MEKCVGCQSTMVWHHYRYGDEEFPCCCRCAPNCPFPDRRVVVVAGNHHQFEFWCREYGFHPRRAHVICADQSHRLRGIGPIEYLLTGTAYSRRDLREILDCLRRDGGRDWNPGPTLTREG